MITLEYTLSVQKFIWPQYQISKYWFNPISIFLLDRLLALSLFVALIQKKIGFWIGDFRVSSDHDGTRDDQVSTNAK